LNILRAKSRVGAMTTNLAFSDRIRKDILVKDRDTTQWTGFPFA
jgi:hypothetical protein